MVRDILTVAFTRHYMANHTVSGRKGNNAGISIKPAMHQEFLLALTRKLKKKPKHLHHDFRLISLYIQYMYFQFYGT